MLTYLLWGIGILVSIIAAIYFGSGLVKAPKAALSIIPAGVLSLFCGVIGLAGALLGFAVWITLAGLPWLIVAIVGFVIGIIASILAYILGLVLWLFTRNRKVYDGLMDNAKKLRKLLRKPLKPLGRWCNTLGEFGEKIVDKLEPLTKFAERVFEWFGNSVSTVGKASVPIYKALWPGWKDDQKII